MHIKAKTLKVQTINAPGIIYYNKKFTVYIKL